METNEIRTDMRKLLRKTLLREYFFQQLSSLYEQVSVKQLACVKQQFLTKRVQLSSIRLDERVEAALAKAARVYQPDKQQLGERQSRGVVNLEVLAPFWVRRREWERYCRGRDMRIERGMEEAEEAQKAFMSRIGCRRNNPFSTHIEAFAGREIAAFQLLQQAISILNATETLRILKKIANFKAKDKSLEQIQSFGETLWMCDWIQALISALKESAAAYKPDLEPYLSLGRLERVQVLDDYSSECTLLTHLKHINSLSDLTKVLSVYTAASLYQLRLIPVCSSLSLPSSLPLPYLRLLHSLVLKSGSLLLTASPALPISP